MTILIYDQYLGQSSKKKDCRTIDSSDNTLDMWTLKLDIIKHFKSLQKKWKQSEEGKSTVVAELLAS